MDQRHGRIRWHRPASTTLEAVAARVSAAPARRSDLLPLLARVGIPVVEGAETAREFALTLLSVAAEVEHALMVQYIYAAISVSPDPSPDGVFYRQRLLRIAVQEMGHLATVQNLLLLLGGRDALHLQRDVLRRHSDENPIPFVLEPVSASSIATYVVAEMPAEIPPELAERVAELVELAEREAGDDIHRVGVIYELLQWMFGSTDDSPLDFAALAPLPDPPVLTDDDLQDPATLARYEALREEWKVFDDDIILPTVHSLADARAAVAAVAAQGEGLQDLDSSHFGEFMQMDRAFQRGDIVVRPMATAPTLGAHTCGPATPITHPYTRLWAHVSDLQYQLLVVTLYQAFGTPRADDGGDGGLRQKLADLALFGMRRVIGTLADCVAELPLRADGTGVAGPPFELDPSVLAPNDDAQLTAQQLCLLDALSARYAAIEAEPDFAAHPDHAITLANLRQFDTDRRGVISPRHSPGGPDDHPLPHLSAHRHRSPR